MTPPNRAKPSNDLITRKLKSLYASVEDEAIPDQFIDLLDQLDRAERLSTKSVKSPETLGGPYRRKDGDADG